MTTLELIRSDLREMHRVQGGWRYAAHPGVMACVLYRIAHAAAQHGVLGRVCSQVLSLVSLMLTSAEIHADALIGPRMRIPHSVGIGVGAGVVAGEGLTLYAHTNLGAGTVEGVFPVLGDDVTVWVKASVLGGVRLGDRVQVAAHALVIGDIPSDHAAIGVPAKASPVSRPG